MSFMNRLNRMKNHLNIETTQRAPSSLLEVEEKQIKFKEWEQLNAVLFQYQNEHIFVRQKTFPLMVIIHLRNYLKWLISGIKQNMAIHYLQKDGK